MASTTISMKEVKKLLNHTIDNNKVLEENNLFPIAISFQGSAGIGKTSFIRQIAQERGMGFTKINLAQIDEAGD